MISIVENGIHCNSCIFLTFGSGSRSGSRSGCWVCCGSGSGSGSGSADGNFGGSGSVWKKNLKLEAEAEAAEFWEPEMKRKRKRQNSESLLWKRKRLKIWPLPHPCLCISLPLILPFHTNNLCKEKNVSKTLPSSLPVILGRRSLGHWSSFYTTIKHLSTFVTTLPMSILVLFHKIIDASSSWWKFGWRNLLSLQLRWNNSENPFSFTSNDV